MDITIPTKLTLDDISMNIVNGKILYSNNKTVDILSYRPNKLLHDELLHAHEIDVEEELKTMYLYEINSLQNKKFVNSLLGEVTKVHTFAISHNSYRIVDVWNKEVKSIIDDVRPEYIIGSPRGTTIIQMNPFFQHGIHTAQETLHPLDLNKVGEYEQNDSIYPVYRDTTNLSDAEQPYILLCKLDNITKILFNYN